MIRVELNMLPNNNKTGSVRNNIKLKRIRAIIVLVEKQ